MNKKYEKHKMILPDDLDAPRDSSEDMLSDKGHAGLDWRLKGEENVRLLNALSDKDGSQTRASFLRKRNMNGTKGLSGMGELQALHEIPLVVWNFACRTYGEKTLRADRKLFNRIFEPWRVVDSSRIRKK